MSLRVRFRQTLFFPLRVCLCVCLRFWGGRGRAASECASVSGADGRPAACQLSWDDHAAAQACRTQCACGRNVDPQLRLASGRDGQRPSLLPQLRASTSAAAQAKVSQRRCGAASTHSARHFRSFIKPGSPWSMLSNLCQKRTRAPPVHAGGRPVSARVALHLSALPVVGIEFSVGAGASILMRNICVALAVVIVGGCRPARVTDAAGLAPGGLAGWSRGA